MANINYGTHEFGSPKTGIGRVTLIDRCGSDGPIGVAVAITWVRNEWRANYVDVFGTEAEAIRWAESVLLVYAEFTPAVCPVCYERIWPWSETAWSSRVELCHDDCVVEVPGDDEVETCPICEFTHGNHDMHPGHECPIGKVSDQYRAGVITFSELSAKVKELTQAHEARGSHPFTTTEEGASAIRPEGNVSNYPRFGVDKTEDEQAAIGERRTYGGERGW